MKLLTVKCVECCRAAECVVGLPLLMDGFAQCVHLEKGPQNYFKMGDPFN